MLNKQRELRWLSDYGSKRYWSTQYVPQNPGLPDDQNKRTEYGTWNLDFAAGEFSYNPKINDKKKSWEFGTRPPGETRNDSNGHPYVYSTEAKLENDKPTEIAFFKSVGISNKHILQGLGSKEILSKISRWRLTGGLLAGTALLSLASGMVLKAMTESEQILTNESVYERSKGIDIELETPEGEPVGGYYAEFWRETGYDDGYYDENLYHVTKNLRIDEPGTYKISALLGSSNPISSIKTRTLVTTWRQPFLDAKENPEKEKKSVRIRSGKH